MYVVSTQMLIAVWCMLTVLCMPYILPTYGIASLISFALKTAAFTRLLRVGSSGKPSQIAIYIYIYIYMYTYIHICMHKSLYTFAYTSMSVPHIP